MDNNIGICAGIALLLMLSSHYVAERWAGRRLPRLACYVTGVSVGIMAPFALWIHLSGGDWSYFFALCFIVAGAGAGTFFAWTSDLVGGVKATGDE